MSFNSERKLVATAQNSISDRMDQPYFVVWQLFSQLDSLSAKPIKKIAYHYRFIVNVSFDPSGTYLATVGGGTSKDSWVLALWKIENLLQLNQTSASQIPIPESVQVLNDLKEIYCVRIVHNTEDDYVTVFLGTDKGLRLFEYKALQQTISEQLTTLRNDPSLIKSVYSLHLLGQDLYISGQS